MNEIGNQLAATAAIIGLLLMLAALVAGWAVGKASDAELREIERDQM